MKAETIGKANSGPRFLRGQLRGRREYFQKNPKRFLKHHRYGQKEMRGGWKAGFQARVQFGGYENSDHRQ
jgi:hypothetical protein